MDPFSLLLVLTFILIMVYWFLTRTYDYWENQKVPFLPNPIPGFGHMLPVVTARDNLFTFATDAYKKTNASAIGFYFLQRPGLIVRDPELVKSILLTNYKSFYVNGVHVAEKADPLIMKNPHFIPDLVKWQESRARVMKHLSSKKLQCLLVIIRKVCRQLNDHLSRKMEDNGCAFECELKDLFVKYTGELVANAAFRVQGQSFEDNPDELAFTNVTKTVFASTLMKSVRQAVIFFLPSVAEFFNVSYIPKSADTYFRERVKCILRGNEETDTSFNDYLQSCIEVNGKDDAEAVTADALIFYSVYQTSSTALSSVFYHLSQNMDVQEKLREHIVTRIEAAGGEVTYESLKSMNYLEQVIYESMRLLSPAGNQIKICTEAITLAGSDGLRYHLLPGQCVIIPNWALHRDDEYWPNPHVFDPDRFNSENVARRSKYVFLPFGEGPRMCVGVRLAIMLMKATTVSLLTRYSIERSTKTRVPLEIDTSGFLLYIKGGLWGVFKKLK